LGSLCQVGPQRGWAWSASDMPASQGSGLGLEGASAVRRQSRTAPYRLRFEGRLRWRLQQMRSGCFPFRPRG
jgi:hypothetical protein